MGRRDNIRQAKDIIAARRSESILTYEKHVEEVSALSSEFKKNMIMLAGTGPRIMAVSLGKAKDDESIESIRRDYDNYVREKKQLLISLGYPEDYCDIKYHCPKCSDTGYVGINICECLKKELVITSLESSGLYSLVENQTFETFSLDYYQNNDRAFMERNIHILQEFAEKFIPGQSDSFIFLGATGLGKTHLSSSVAQVVIKKGSYVVYESAIKIFEDYEEKKFGSRSYSSDTEFEYEKYEDCDLLIIDDLGCEMTNQLTLSALYNIINVRLIQHKSTIISTNLPREELRKRYSDRIISRIFGDYKPLIFRGADVREQKLRKNL